MLTVAPSTTTNNNRSTNKEKIPDDVRAVRTLLIKKQGQDNQSDTNSFTSNSVLSTLHGNTVSTLSFNQYNTEESCSHQQQIPDETLFEQVYHFQQNGEGIPRPRTQQKEVDSKPFLSIAAAFNNRNRQALQDDAGIQLPLIETHQARPMSRDLQMKKTRICLDAVALKRQRNPNNSTITSEEAKQSLLNLKAHESETQNVSTTFESSVLRFQDASNRKKAYNYESSTTSFHYDDPSNKFLSSSQSLCYTPTNESSRICSSRMKNRILNRPVSTPDFQSDKRNNFRLIIQDGIIKDQTEVFLQFRQCFTTIWDRIMRVIRMLEKLMDDYFVSIALIDGEKVAELVRSIGEKRRPTLVELLATVINRDDVEKLLKQPGRRFRGRIGKERAAVIIQSYWRAFYARRAYQYLRKRRRAAHVIASAWLHYSKLSKLRKQLKSARRRQLEFFEQKQTELKQQWSYISTHRRTIVHMPSLGLTESIRKNLLNLPLQQNYQIGRLCELEDPNIDVIYVSPLPVNDEILQYYNKLISLRALVEKGNEQPATSISNDVSERFVIIVPEALNRFPGHRMCLATLLKYSPKALKQIKSLIKDRPAYLVTGISSVDDLYISEYLDIPIYGCEPESSYLYSTKSGSKRIFKSSNVPMPFGQYDIYDQRRLLESLASLIVQHLDIKRWIFKIDDNFDGQGIAYCDIAVHLPCYNNVLKVAEKHGEKWANEAVQKDSYLKILSELSDVLHQHTVIVNKTQFDSWETYMKVFLTEGGVIEAYPPSDTIAAVTVCLSIEPDGRYSLICSGDQLHTESQFSCWGLSFPQSSIDSNQLNAYCSSIVDQCKQRKIYGYIDVDFLAFMDKKSKRQKLWVIDLCIGYSEHVSHYRVMQYVTMGKFDSETHSFTVRTKQIKQRLRNWQNGAPEYIVSDKIRFGIWSSKLHHRNLANLHYSIFFNMCRTHGIGFDVREKQGTLFTLFESDQHEHVGMITIGDTQRYSLSNFAAYLTTIYQEITPNDTTETNNFLIAASGIGNLLGITHEQVSNV